MSYWVSWLVNDIRVEEEEGRPGVTSLISQYFCKCTAEDTKTPKFDHYNQPEVIHYEKQLDLCNTV